MRKAKLTYTGVEGYAKLPYENRVIFVYEDGHMDNFDISGVQYLEPIEQLSKETQAQAILFEGQCKLQSMIADNRQREYLGRGVDWNGGDFGDIQDEIESKLKELK